MIGQLLERAFLCGQLILSLAEVVKQSLYAGSSWGWVKNLEPGGKERSLKFEQIRYMVFFFLFSIDLWGQILTIIYETQNGVLRRM